MLKRIKPIIIKEFRQVSRDRRTLGILFFFPAFLLVMFGYALNFDVKHISLAVCDQDKSPTSRALVENFLHTEYFDFTYYLAAPGEIDAAMERGEVRAVLVIPPDFTERVLAGKQAPIQFVVDGANATEAATAVGYANAILLNYSAKIFMEAVKRFSGSRLALPVDARPRVWYNPELKSAKFLIPGLIGFLMMIMTVVSTAMSIVREKEQGTMEQIAVSPIRPEELILGKSLPYVLISFAAAVVVLIVANGLFDVVVQGSVWVLLLVTLLYITAGLGMGLLISSLVSTQQVAFFLALITTMLPTMLLSGFVFPIKNMPIPIQVVTYIIPARYYLVALRGIVLKGVGLVTFWDQILFIVAFSIVMMGISSVRLARQRM